MTPTKPVPTFDDLQKDFVNERTRNNLLAYIGLCVFGGIFIVLAVTTKGVVSDVLSDFLVNIAAGLFSAAVLFAAIQRVFFDKEKDNERTNALIRGSYQYNILLDQATASVAKVTLMINQYKSLLSRGENKRPEAKLAYLNRAKVILTRAVEQNTTTKGYTDIALSAIRHLWDEYYVELKKTDPHIADLINLQLARVLRLTARFKDTEELLKEHVELNNDAIAQVEKEIAAKEKPVN